MDDQVELLTVTPTSLQAVPLKPSARTSYSRNPLHSEAANEEAASSAAPCQAPVASAASFQAPSPLSGSAVDTDSEEASADEEAAMLRKRNGRLSGLKLSLALVVFVSSMLLFWNFGPVSAVIEALSAACEWIQRNTLVGAMLFIPCEILWVFFCIPLTPLEIAAGYAFGLGVGLVVNTAGKLLGSVLSFLVGRHCLRDHVSRAWGGKSSSVGDLLRSVDHALSTTGKNSSESFQLLFLIQLAYIPVALKNYGLSLTSVSLSHFVVTAALGEAPGTLAAVWMGASSRDLVGLLHGDASSSGHATAQVAVDAAGAVSLVLVLVVLGRRIQRRLHDLGPVPTLAAPGDESAAYAQVT